MNTDQQNERIDSKILKALRDESPLSKSEIAKQTGLDIEIVILSIHRLIRQNYVEACPVGFILTELAEDVCFGGEG
ncbi:winged helix-turn-helix domain-containing protein [Acinetobacter beijerinckii]|uniref:winged helix-turn-helix domain-containing protein n=1 Tax=Acinetobacter beijerinckii TaxID=262668 RepID=UPI002405F468|nr:winged helix-turn-helix domain-containing protein [Acinetobacter beijerinckii]